MKKLSEPSESDYIMELIRSVIENRCPAEPPNQLNWNNLYQMASDHMIVNLLCYGVNRLSPEQQPESEILQKFRHAQKVMIAKEAVQSMAFEQLLEAFEAKGLRCVPLKGYLLKALYPSPDMRSMSDLDFLIDETQKDLIEPEMGRLGFTYDHSTEYHDTYTQKPFLSVELHSELVQKGSSYYDYFKQIWNLTEKKKEYESIHFLSPEDHFHYVIMHMAKHIVSMGAGIRTILDAYLYVHTYGRQMDWTYLEQEMKKTKLWEFSQNIIDLGRVWFENGAATEKSKHLEAYIISSGIYGRTSHGEINGLINRSTDKRPEQSNKRFHAMREKAHYVFRELLFPGLTIVEAGFPYVKSCPFLLPVAWLHRAWRGVFVDKGKWSGIRSKMKAVNGQALKERYDLFKEVGLK